MGASKCTARAMGRPKLTEIGTVTMSGQGALRVKAGCVGVCGLGVPRRYRAPGCASLRHLLRRHKATAPRRHRGCARTRAGFDGACCVPHSTRKRK
eukprot:scaffold87891_cov23-Tisochrysis_lutea.AAC.2